MHIKLVLLVEKFYTNIIDSRSCGNIEDRSAVLEIW